MADQPKQTISTFDPKTARLILRFVQEKLGLIPDPSNQNSGRWVSQSHTFAKITDHATDGSVVKHAWTEVRFKPLDGTWVEVPQGRQGSTTVNYVINGNDPTVTFVNDTILEVRKMEDPNTRKNYYVGGSTSACSTDSPSTIGSDSEMSETPADVSWTSDPNGSETYNGTSLDLWLSLGSVYDEGGSQVLKDIKILLRFNSCGNLYFAGNITVVDIDTPVECVPAS